MLFFLKYTTPYSQNRLLHKKTKNSSAGLYILLLPRSSEKKLYNDNSATIARQSLKWFFINRQSVHTPCHRSPVLIAYKKKERKHNMALNLQHSDFWNIDFYPNTPNRIVNVTSPTIISITSHRSFSFFLFPYTSLDPFSHNTDKPPHPQKSFFHRLCISS